MYYGEIWIGIFHKQFEYFMKTKGTPIFLMKKSLNTGVVIDLELLDSFKKICSKYHYSVRFELISVSNYDHFFRHVSGAVLRKFTLVG